MHTTEQTMGFVKKRGDSIFQNFSGNTKTVLKLLNIHFEINKTALKKMPYYLIFIVNYFRRELILIQQF